MVKAINWRVFVISVILQFLITSLVMLGVKPPKIFSRPTGLISPQSETKVDHMANILPKLEQQKLRFSIKRPTEFISTVHAAGDFDEASAYGVVDFDTGEVLLEKNFSEKLPIASITKVMTAVVALDLASPDEEITISSVAERVEPSKVMLKEGEVQTLDSLLHDILLASANDAAQAIKDGIDEKYGAPIFIDAMNAKAKFLGLKNSHFTNPQGFDNPEHYSSIEDLAILSHYAMTNYPKIAELVKKQTADLTEGADDRFYLFNWNGLLGVYPGVSGIKIGNTAKAGKTTAVMAERDGKRLIAVVLGAPGVLERDEWTAEILDKGFEKYDIEPANITEGQLRAKYRSWTR